MLSEAQATPNKGTSMGPCHACDYVDVFTGELDEKLVNTATVSLLTSIASTAPGCPLVLISRLESFLRRCLCNTTGWNKCRRVQMSSPAVASREHQVDSLAWKGGRISWPPHQHHLGWEDKDGHPFEKLPQLSFSYIMPCTICIKGKKREKKRLRG